MRNYKHIFTPIKIGKIMAKNRIEVTPVMCILATKEGDVSRELIEWVKGIS